MISTIQELENLYYGSESDYITKTDAPVITTTTGVYNAVFGKFVWKMFNQEANAFGILPKTVWRKSGWRLATARATSVSYGGISEGGSLPDSIKPTFAEVTNTLKTVAHMFEVSEIQQYLASVDDDATSDLEMSRQNMAEKHKEDMNIALLSDASAEAAAATANYAGRTGFESLDRVISSDSEEDAFGGTYTTYFDIFGLDRDSATTYDSVVSHNSGTDRSVSDLLIRTLIYDCKEAGANTTVLLTGWDTTRSIVALYADQVRYNNPLDTAKVKISVNGIETEEGAGVGMRVTSIYGIPLIQSKNTTQDTISRIYALDTSDPEGSGEARLSLSIAKPTQYFQSGVDADSPFPIDKFTTQGLFRTLGEIKCTRLDVQGKLRDLS